MSQESDAQARELLLRFISNHPGITAQQFRNDRQKYYLGQYHVIEQVIAEAGLQDESLPIAPEPLVIEPQSAPKTETSPLTSTGDKEMDEVIAELVEQPKKKTPRTWKQQHGKRQATADAAKALIVLFLNQG